MHDFFNYFIFFSGNVSLIFTFQKINLKETEETAKCGTYVGCDFVNLLNSDHSTEVVTQ